MSKSNHQKYLRKLNDEYELIRPIDNPITKCDVLRFKRYEYTTPSIEKIGNRIKNNLNYSLITGDIKRKYPVDIRDGKESYLDIAFPLPSHFCSLWIRTDFILLPVQTLMGRTIGGWKTWIQIKGLILQVPNIQRRNLSLFMVREDQRNCIRFKVGHNQGLWTWWNWFS